MTKITLAALMAAHHQAFLTKAAVGVWERRDEPTLKSVAETIDRINRAFDEYKRVNDERIEAVKSGRATGDVDAKLARLDDAIGSLQEQKSRLEKLETRLARPGAVAGGKEEHSPEAQAYKGAFLNWMRAPGDPERRMALQQRGKELAAASGSQELEARSTQSVTNNGAAGGFALPEVIERQIARLAVDVSPIRSIATVRSVSTTDYKELFDINGAGFEWLGEAATRNQTNTPDLAQVAPTFGLASAKPQASEEALDDLFFDVESWLIQSAAETIAQGEGAAFVSGNGTNKPTGFLAGPAPVTTADATRPFGKLQYIAGGEAAAMPTSLNPFLDLVYAVRARYRTNARWVTSKAVLAALRKYQDLDGSYLWQPSVQAGQPDRFLGFPVVEAEDMPAVGANAFPVAFGDFREGYLIVDRVGMRITRDEITTPGFVKFYVRRRVGGTIRNSQAIKLLKIAAN